MLEVVLKRLSEKSIANFFKSLNYIIMNKKKQLRLAALMRKGVESLTETEKVEYDTLVTEAKAANIDYESEAFKNAKEDDIVDAEQLKGIIADVVKDATKGMDIDQDALVEKLKGISGVSMDKVKEVVSEAVGNTAIDEKALVQAITEKMPSQGVTQVDLQNALKEFADSIKDSTKSASRMQFDASFGGNLPVEHRSGNMAVSEKQLLNLCLAKVSDGAKQTTIDRGGEIPTHMNHGITKDQLKQAAAYGKRVLANAKALTTGSAGNGAELIPTDLSSELQRRFYLESTLANSMIASEIDMPSNTFEMPLLQTRTNFFVGSEGGSVTESTPATSLTTLQAKKLIGYSKFSYEADEDSIVPILPMLTTAMVEGAADAFEGALINGDTTATHQDSDINGVANHHAKLFNGFRKLAIAGSLQNDLSTGGVTAANILAAKKTMAKYGIKPQELLLIVGPQGYNDLVGLEETLTFEKVGNAPAARILTGNADSIFGIPIVISSQVREDLNDSGVFDSSTTTKGSMLLVHKPSFLVGSRRGFTVEVDTDIKAQTNDVVASFRRDFKAVEAPASAIPTVRLLHNYTA